MIEGRTTTTEVAQNLTEIMHLWEKLIIVAASPNKRHGANPEMPGGDAMVALGPVANQEAWTNMQGATERHEAGVEGYRRPYTSVVDEDGEETPLQRIRWWSERWRRQHGAEYGQDPTVATEVNFIRYNLDWAFLNEAQWEQFADDMQAARTRLENITHTGTRDIFSDDVACLMCESPLRRRMGLAGYEDEWWCPTCRVHLTSAQFNLAASHAGRARLGLA